MNRQMEKEAECENGQIDIDLYRQREKWMDRQMEKDSQMV
jgi:hypothetical protein